MKMKDDIVTKATSCDKNKNSYSDFVIYIQEFKKPKTD